MAGTYEGSIVGLSVGCDDSASDGDGDCDVGTAVGDGVETKDGSTVGLSVG